MRSKRRQRVGALLVAVACAASAPAARAEGSRSARSVYGTLGVDTLVTGRAEGERGDLSYFFLMTPRVHFGIGDHAAVSMGIGLPVLQAFLIGAGGNSSNSAGNRNPRDLFATGLGVNTPFELRLTPSHRGSGGVVFTLGAAPVLNTAVVCALGGDCPGRKSLAVVLGYAAHGGVGYQWKDGTFVTASYATGHLFAGGHSGGVGALEGMYSGGWLSFGFAL